MQRTRFRTSGTASFALLLAASACRTASSTALIVVVDTDLASPGDLDSVTVSVRGPTGGGATASTATLDATQAGRPWWVEAEPRGSTDGAVTITVTGRLGADAVVSSTVRTTYVAGDRRTIHVFLSHDCVGVTPACGAGTSCDHGLCNPIDDVPANGLPSWTGDPGPAFVPPSVVACDPPWTPRADASRTGVPPGTVLTEQALGGQGGLTIDTDDTVLDAVHVAGSITVAAQRVTIRRSRIDGAVTVTGSGDRFLVIEDSELGLAGHVDPDAVTGTDHFTMRRCNVHDFVRAVLLGTHVRIVDSYIHDLARDRAGSTYGIFGNGAVHGAVCHTSIESPTDSGECLFLDNATGDIDTFDVAYNHFDGGAFGLLLADAVQMGHTVQSVHVVSNRFASRADRGTAVHSFGSDQPGALWSDNAFDDGMPITP